MSLRPTGPASSPTPIPTTTGLLDHRVRGNSVLVLTCLRTGSRHRSAADSSLQATAADRIMSAHQGLELAQHGVAHEIRKVIVQGVAIRLQDPALPALARIENSPILAARKRGAQACPATAPETGHCAKRVAPACSQPHDQRLELANRGGALSATPDTEISQGLGAERRGAQIERLLAIAVNGNELAERFYRVLMTHALLFRALSRAGARRSSRRCAMPRQPPHPPQGGTPGRGRAAGSWHNFHLLYLFTEAYGPSQRLRPLLAS